MLGRVTGPWPGIGPDVGEQIWDKLAGRLPGLKEIELWEIPESSVVYRGEDSRIKGA